MTAALEVVGLFALIVAGFLAWVPLGFVVLGASCLWVAWEQARRARRAAEAAEARKAARVA